MAINKGIVTINKKLMLLHHHIDQQILKLQISQS